MVMILCENLKKLKKSFDMNNVTYIIGISKLSLIILNIEILKNVQYREIKFFSAISSRTYMEVQIWNFQIWNLTMFLGNSNMGSL